MQNSFRIIILLLVGLFPFIATAQTSPTTLGTVKGILRDTAHNYNLKSATVSLYKADSSLVKYQLSNTYGEFTFGNIPLNTKMYVEISHVGYYLLRKNFTVVDAKIPVDLKMLTLTPKDNTLKEVEVRIPPVTMNGDTLEFNAAAFKLDSNAVVEDLLRKIPNITVWGDGQITVNGREIKSLLVNGKPFFGGDIKTATQNIAKNALQKIQVYSTVQNRDNPLDSTMEMNLKLKKGKDVGYFGKVGAGIGTDKRYEADASINVFSPKLQAAIIGASNNVNKIANSVKTLTANATFKGVGTNVEYMPDFNQTGINKTHTGGFNFTYNFIEKPTWQAKNTLIANYFLQRKIYDNLTDAQTATTLKTNEIIADRNITNNTAEYDNHKLDANYSLLKNGHELDFRKTLTVTRALTIATVIEKATIRTEC